jgi:hypothetical protein
MLLPIRVVGSRISLQNGVARISPGGWTIGPLVAAIMRHGLTPSWSTVNQSLNTSLITGVSAEWISSIFFVPLHSTEICSAQTPECVKARVENKVIFYCFFTCVNIYTNYEYRLRLKEKEESPELYVIDSQ